MISQKHGNARGADPVEKKGFVEKINDVLRKHRVKFLALIGIIILFVLGTGIYSVMNDLAVEKSAAAIIRMDTAFSAWSGADEAKKAEMETALVAELASSEKANQGRYASLRASLLRARYLGEKKDWSAAEEAFLAVYKKAPASELAPGALLNAASAAEERGDVNTAIKHLTQLVTEFPKTAGIAYVHFSLGRLFETIKDSVKAKSHYDLCISTYPDDNWTKLAKDRIIAMELSGL